MNKNNKKFNSKPMHTVKSTPPTSWKKRLPAFVLLAFMVFWTIGSIFAVWLAFDNGKSNSGVITASAEESISNGAKNATAYEIPIDGLTSACFKFYNDNDVLVDGEVTYKVSLYLDVYDGAYLYFYDYGDNNYKSPDCYKNGPTLSKFRLSKNVSSCCLDCYDSDCYYYAWSSDGIPSMGFTPVQVSYAPLSTSSYQGLSLKGYQVRVFFLTNTGSTRTYTFNFGIDGSYFVSPLQGTYTGFYTIPTAPLTYEDFLYYDINANHIADLQEQIKDLQNDLSTFYNDGYNDGRAEGEDIGYANGYGIGYNKGVADSGNYSFTSLIGAVIDVPVQTFLGLFDFELLNVNMASFFLSLLTLAVILAIVKVFI